MKENIVAYMKTAFHTEVTGYNFYLHAVEIVDDEHGKNVFKHLAKEELEHIRVLSTIAKSIEDTGRWLKYEDALVVVSPNYSLPIFPQENEFIKRLEKNPVELDMLNIAINIEEDAMNFYTIHLRLAKDADEKVLLAKLVEMEKGHLKLLRWEYESIVHTGFWCDFMEFTVEGERE